jgi:aliphatic nitrilase
MRRSTHRSFRARWSVRSSPKQIEVTIRHHALESGCFVVNSTGWLTEAQIASITPNEGLQRGLRGGCMTAIVSPEGRHLAPPLTEGEGVLLADLDLSLIVKRKRMMDSVGHYARPELISVQLDQRPARPLHRSPEPALSAEGDGHEPSDRTPDQRVAELWRSAG